MTTSCFAAGGAENGERSDSRGWSLPGGGTSGPGSPRRVTEATHLDQVALELEHKVLEAQRDRAQAAAEPPDKEN